MKPLERLATVSAANHGLVTRAQIAEFGLSDHSFRSYLGQGVLVRVCQGLYRFVGVPQTWQQRLATACLYYGASSMGSHRSASTVWELDRYRSASVEVMSAWPHQRKAATCLPFDTVHRVSRDLPAGDSTRRSGLVVTTPTRTLIDMGSCVSALRLGSMMDDAVRRGLTTYEKLWTRTSQLTKPGRRGLAVVRSALSSRHIGGPVPGSPLEVQMLKLIREAHLPEPMLQFPVACGEVTYHLDLAWPDQLVGIECDGFRFHRLPADLDSDTRRSNELSLRGWLIHRATFNQVRADPARVVSDVRRALYYRRTNPVIR